METFELLTQVRAALIGNADLMRILPLGEKAIYHNVAPSTEPRRYPIIVYSAISDVPILAGDNVEVAHKVTIRLHVITSTKRYAAGENNFISTCRLVKETMTGLSFVRRQTTPLVSEGKTMMIFDFVKGV